MKISKRFAAIAAAAALSINLVGCTNTSSVSKDQQTTNDIMLTYQANQPVPSAPWSQYRQTVIDVENAQIHGQLTTTFEFNTGVVDPIYDCPSVGFPIPSTTQLTNPDQIAYANGSASQVVGQAESTGVYTGDSSGTYIVCVASDSTKYIDYWEGWVKTIGAPAHWDATKRKVVMDGAPTVVANTKK